MKRTLPVIASVVLGAACAHPARSTATRPAPVTQRDSILPVGAGLAQQSGSPVPSSTSGATSPARGATNGASDIARLSSKDVVRRAADVFGDSSVVRPDSLADSALATPTWDIDVHPYESTDRVEHYVHLFTTTAKDRIQARLERGTRYETMIRQKMRDGGLPEDMYYLALVESGFDPNAYSRAAAVGMWQFMTSTGRDMGLRIDWWVDERRDPVKSTTAAVRFIKDLREQFGSLYLAAAAYNGGPGRIARGLTRYADDLEGTTGDDLFFALADKDYLRNETREYVPQLIAAALIAKEPERYDMKLTPQPPFTYDSVRVGPGTPLAAIGHAADATVADMQDLNPQILRGMTPPRDSSFIRIPAGAADSFAVAFAGLPTSEKVGLFTVESKKGQTLATIADAHDISARQLALYNPSLHALKSGRLAVGQRVLIPATAVAAAAATVPDPSIERYGNSSESKSVTTHVVKSGESLGAIAQRYHTSTAALMRSNGLKRAMIFPGQSIIVKGSASTHSSKSASNTTEKATPRAKASSKKEPVRAEASDKAPSTTKQATTKKTTSHKKKRQS